MAFRPVEKPKVILIGLSLELYREEERIFFHYYEEFFEKWKELLASKAEILTSAVCCLPEEILSVFAKVPAGTADAVVMAPLSYTLGGLVGSVLDQMPAPLVLWNTQQATGFDGSYKPLDLTLNHTVQGMHDITNVLMRRHFPFEIVSGHYADPATLSSLEEVLEAARAVHAGRTIHTAALGGKFEGMDDFLFDAAYIRKKFGWTFSEIPLPEYAEAWHKADEALCKKIAEEDFANYDIKEGLTKEDHMLSVRGYLALRKLAEKYGADALTFNFLAANDKEAVPAGTPFYGINRLMGEGMGYAGEGDTLRAALLSQMRFLAGEAIFTEIYTVDFQRNRMMMTHMQECNPAFARKDRKIELRSMPFWLPGVPPYTGMYFTAEPGPATLLSLTEDGAGGCRLIAFAGEIDDMPPLAEFNRGHWVFHCGDINPLLDAYSRAGGPHHLVAIRGDRRKQLATYCRMMNIDFFNLGGLK